MTAAPEIPRDGRVTRRRPIARAADLLVLAAAVGALVAADALGRASRASLPGTRIVHCGGPDELLSAWRSAPVRGRTLLHVTRQVAMHTDPGAALENSYVYRAVRDGVVRRIYHVIPEAAWPQVAENLRAVPAAWPHGRTFRVVVEGTRIVVLRLSDLPPLDEPVLVDLDVSAYSAVELTALAERLSRRAPATDLVAWYGAPALPAALEVLGAMAR